VARSPGFTLREVTFRRPAVHDGKRGPAPFSSANTLINVAADRLYSPGRLQKAMETTWPTSRGGFKYGKPMMFEELRAEAKTYSKPRLKEFISKSPD